MFTLISWARAQGGRIAPQPFPSTAFQSQHTAGYCLDFGQDKVLLRQVTTEDAEGWGRTPGMDPFKSPLEMQKRARNQILSLRQEKKTESFPLTIQDTSQHQETEAEKLQLLHFAAESGSGWAGGDGEVRAAEVSSALLLVAPCCLFILPALWLSLSVGEEGWEVATSLTTGWILI